tara:strand:+ start:2311 stop:2616 length:306 start_codon:yes stop_codon:yes gene_type:complete
MSKENEDHNSDMTIEEKMEYENYIVDQAFENSYQVLTSRSTFEDLLDKKTKYGVKAIMIYDPTEDPDEDIYDDIIYYYEDLEEYERCAELLSIKNKIFEDV